MIYTNQKQESQWVPPFLALSQRYCYNIWWTHLGRQLFDTKNVAFYIRYVDGTTNVQFTKHNSRDNPQVFKSGPHKSPIQSHTRK